MLGSLKVTLLSAALHPSITIGDGGSWAIWKSLKKIAGELSFGALIVCVIAVIIAAAFMGIGQMSDNPAMKAKGKTALLWSIVAAAVIGGAAGLITFANGIDIV